MTAQDYVSPQEALWTLNVSSRTWRQQFASGVLPEPVTACGLAVANGRAYLLSFLHKRQGVMEIYKLNCNWEGAWTQHCLFNKLLGQPAQGYVCVWGQCPELKDDLQNQWLFHTGEHSCCGIYIFELATLSWSKPEVTGKPLRPRSCYLATCHEDSMIMMGGSASACSSQLQLRLHLWF